MSGDAVRRVFREVTGLDCGSDGLTWLSDAMAGRTGTVEAGGDRFFVKWSDTTDGMDVLDAEADGLRRLHMACPEHVVGVIGVARSEDGPGTLLVLEFVERGSAAADYDAQLARGLAAVHAVTTDSFGLERDNYIGATPQVNGACRTWPRFFAERRLLPLARRLQGSGGWPAHWNSPFDRLIERLPQLLPHRPDPSLLHGDLWSGNVMTAEDGRPVLIDPAVYYGHAETDLAMMKLFGGFGRRVFDRYADIAGAEPGFSDRADIYNLYHLLNHVVLFGVGYHGGVERILGRFGT